MSFRVARIFNSRCLTPTRNGVVNAHCTVFAKSYATRRSSASDLLAQTLDTKHQSGRRQDSVGPFTLGVSPSAQSAQNVKKWSELGTGGKAMRATARTSNLLVILCGAGFSAILVYALTSELFSKNSPTVLHNEVCKMIENSPRITRYLHAPLSFHNSPPSGIRPRHRNRQVLSQRAVDQWGREHMILQFYVQGSEPGSSQQSTSDSYIDSVVNWSSKKFTVLSEMSFDDMVEEAKERASRAKENSKSLIRFLSGEAESLESKPSYPIHETLPSEKKSESVLWNLTSGLFSGIKGRGGGGHEDRFDGRAFTEGEVHVDCVLNSQGYYDFQTVEVTVGPHTSNPVRIRLV